jgi:hypothetical protein
MADQNNNNGFKDDRRDAWEERPLDPGERRAFRQMRRDWEWYTTVTKLLKSVSLWAVGVAGAVWAGREAAAKLLKALLQ